MNSRKLASTIVATALALTAVPAFAHSTATAIYCDEDFGSDGAYSGFVNSGGHLVYSGGANNNGDHEEGIGCRINVGGGHGAFRMSLTYAGEADPLVFYVYLYRGETFYSNAGINVTTSTNSSGTTNVYTFAGLPASYTGHNSGMEYIYLTDYGSVAAGNFTDVLLPPVVDGSNPTAVSHYAQEDCLDYVDGQVVYDP